MSGKKEDGGDTMFFVLIVLLILSVLLMPILYKYFIMSWRYISIGIFFVLSYIPTPLLNIMFPWAYLSGIHDLNASASGAYKLLVNYNAPFFISEPKALDKVAGFFRLLFFPYVVIPFVIGMWKVLSKKNFVKIFGAGKKLKAIDELILQESTLWPGIRVVINAHPELIKSLDSGEWAMSRRPETFVRDEGLVRDDTDDLDNKYFTLIEDKAFRKMVDQLGPKFNGFDKLNREERQFLSIILPKACRDKEVAEKMIAEFANYYSSGKKTFMEKIKLKSEARKLDKKVNGLIAKYEKHPVIVQALNKNFYVKTLFASLLELARKDGVLSNGEFLWLKLKKRDLWYMMCNVGRRASFIECAGPWSHWLAEKALDKKISNPMVMNAVKGIDQYLIDNYEEYRSAFEDEDSDDY